MAMEFGRGVVTYLFARGMLQRNVRWDMLGITKDIQSELTGWRCDSGCDGRMEAWKAPWLTTESGFTDMIIGPQLIRSRNVYECGLL